MRVATGITLTLPCAPQRVVRDTVAACERRYASLFNLSEGRIDAGTDDPPRTVMRDHLADVRALFPRTAPPAAGGPAPPAASAAAGAEATAEQQEEALAASAPPEDEGPRGGSLVPAPEYEPGKAYLAIRVSTAGLKDAMTYTHPFIRVSVRGTTLAAAYALHWAPCVEEQPIASCCVAPSPWVGGGRDGGLRGAIDSLLTEATQRTPYATPLTR